MTPTKQPRCPACQSPDLQVEDVATMRAQCQRCRWRCVIEADGSTRDWLNVGRYRAALQPNPQPTTTRHQTRNVKGRSHA